VNVLTSIIRRLLQAVLLLFIGGILLVVYLLPAKRRHRP